MNQKIILGMLSSDSYNEKNRFLEVLLKNGFISCSITDKVKEISKYLLKSKKADAITDCFISDTRKKAYSINRLYWINLLLTSINSKENIVVTDIWDEDMYGNYVLPIVSDQIFSPKNEHVIFPMHISDASVKNLIEEINRKLYNRK